MVENQILILSKWGQIFEGNFRRIFGTLSRNFEDKKTWVYVFMQPF